MLDGGSVCLKVGGCAPLGQKRKRDGIHSVPFLRTVIAAGDVGDVNPRLLIPGQISTVLSAKETSARHIHYTTFALSPPPNKVEALSRWSIPCSLGRFASTLSGTMLSRTPLNVVLPAKGPRARTTQVTTAGASRHPIWDSDRSRRSGPRVSFPTSITIKDLSVMSKGRTLRKCRSIVRQTSWQQAIKHFML